MPINYLLSLPDTHTHTHTQQCDRVWFLIIGIVSNPSVAVSLSRGFEDLVMHVHL